MYILIAKNFYNQSIYWIIEIFLVLCNTYVGPKDQDKVTFYINNYIYGDQFNQLYNPNKIKKGIKNVNTVAYKLKFALTKVINQGLEIAKKER